MALIDWTDAYKTGHREVDLQHEHLFGLLNRLHDRIMSGNGKSTVGEILVELTEYVCKHFQEEEELMTAAGYPEYEDHHGLHLKLVAKVDDFRQSQSTAQPVSPLDLVRFLSGWIQYHILLEDLKLVRWLGSSATSPAVGGKTN